VVIVVRVGAGTALMDSTKKPVYAAEIGLFGTIFDAF
tara:strand:+ start:352 stop:462 length:111 start_codon:yes stop_codon:yes gene_type:complete